MPTVAVTDLEIDTLRRDGAVCLRSVIDMDCVETLRSGIDNGLASPSVYQTNQTPPNELGRHVKDLYVSQFQQEFETVVHSSNLASLAAKMLGLPQVRFWFDSWIVKYPCTMQRTSWHQDHGIDGQSIIIWVPLDRVPRGSGLEVVRGSHRTQVCYYRPLFNDVVEAAAAEGRIDIESSGGRRLARISEVEETIAQDDVLSWDMEPGDCVVVDCHALHAGAANLTAHAIRRYSSRWLDPAATLAPHGAEITAMMKQRDPGLPVSLGDGILFDNAVFPLLPKLKGRHAEPA